MLRALLRFSSYIISESCFGLFFFSPIFLFIRNAARLHFTWQRNIIHNKLFLILEKRKVLHQWICISTYTPYIVCAYKYKYSACARSYREYTLYTIHIHTPSCISVFFEMVYTIYNIHYTELHYVMSSGFFRLFVRSFFLSFIFFFMYALALYLL